MILSSEPFVPHPLEHLIQVRALSANPPENFYNQMCSDYEMVTDVTTNRIIYESDGLKVTGISALPEQVKNKNHPIMIYNRGGNREFGKLTVLSVMRSIIPFARTGYLVYASNYRGNDGGEGKEEFGGVDFNDVSNLMEIAKENPAWDGKNIFMLGHSRGGMMTYLSLRRNKSITAAISIAGAADMFDSLIERPEMEEKVYKQLILAEGSEREKAYIDRSAVCWADEIDTPLLLLHGTADDRVKVDESIKLAEKLKEFGKQHELVLYEDGNHALLRHWDEVLKKSISWFERFRR